jgi:signal transduction histidine kinase
MLPRSPTIDWTMTQYETALVRVNLHAPAATTASAELTLSTRCRHRRFTELPRPAAHDDDDDGIPGLAATFEVPVAMVHRKGLRARITVGPIDSPLDWGDLANVGPLPAAEFASHGAWLVREVPEPRTPLLRTAPGPVPPRRRATTARASARATARALAHGRTQPPTGLARVVAPAPLAPAGPSVPSRSAFREPEPEEGSPADGGPPLAVDRTLLQFLPYEQAAPRLALPISLTGDVLTVAVALPSVDLSFITDRSPWLRIEREVTGYQRIVKALREVEATRGSCAEAALETASPTLEHATAGAAPAGGPRRRLDAPAEDVARSRAARRRSFSGGVARLREIAAEARARNAARARQRGIAGALARLTHDRQRQMAVAAAAGVAATAALAAMSTPSATADVAARAALDTAACVGALGMAYLALALHRRRGSPASLVLVLVSSALAVAVLAVAALGALPRPGWANGVGDLLASVVVQTLGVVALAGAALVLAARSRRLGDDLLSWCSLGAMWLAIAHVDAVLAPSAGGWISAADLFRLFAAMSFLVGAAREIAAHGRQLASTAVAQERRRMARELHDGVAQELAFIVSQASSLARHEWPAGPLQSIALAGERALVDSRRSIHKLTRPDPSTLHEAITEQASLWAKRAGLKLEVQMPEDIETSPEMQHAILRIVQEAISNAVRHAGATRLMVSLSERDGCVTVRISDDGRGFDAHPSSLEPERGFGLVSMAERAEAFGGQLRLESEPGRGTVVEVAFR